jgi:hypothetical protein
MKKATQRVAFFIYKKYFAEKLDFDLQAL